MTTVQVGDRLYVIAGGSDDGLSLFTLLPNGKLVHLDTVWDTNSTALQNVSALDAAVVDGQIVVFATSETETGITRFTVDTEPAGVTLQGGISADTLSGGSNSDLILGGYGDDTLSGGAGRDILEDGAGQDTMTGGAGADVFRLTSDGNVDTITDFNPAQDTLDLSGYHMLYDAKQLQITSTGWGAIITYRDEVLHVSRGGGGSLDASHFKTKDTLTLDRPPSGFDYFPETVNGTASNDTIEGSVGFDTLHGMAGDDVLLWSGGGDLFYGGAGIDTVSYAGATDCVVVNLATGKTDHAALGEQFDSIENLTGSDFNDVLVGDAGDNTLVGGAGDDILCGGAGQDWLDGGVGLDSVSYATSAQGITISLQDGTGGTGDVLISIEGVVGSAHADDVTGDDGENRLAGGGGADILNGLGDNDELFGNDGNDTLIGGDGDDVLDGGDGDDFLIGGSGADHFIGGGGIDTADFSSMGSALTMDLLTGLRKGWAIGDQFHSIEVIVATEFKDNLGGSNDAETLVGNGGDDTIRANGGDDTVLGGDGNDRLWGGTGHDVVSGGDGNDLLYGQSGNDRLIGGEGADTLLGGGGIDIADYRHEIDGFIFNFATGYHTGAAANDTFDSIEGVAGGRGADTLIGAGTDDILEGGGGHDLINGGDGDDTLIGGHGRDKFIAGNGADLFDGSAGVDTIDMRANSSAATVDLTAGTGDESMVGDQFINIENLIGTNYGDRFVGNGFNNRLVGRAGSDTLAGASGNDVLLGGNGADQLTGGRGNDRIWGNSGRDTLAGSAGRDTLRGGNGNDMLDGGTGRDTLIGGKGRDTFVFNSGVDRIRDFHHRHDKLLFENDLWGGGRKSVKMILKFAKIQGNKAVFDFGDGDKLIIDGISSLTHLKDNIDFY
nr:calcium-binding protein [Aliiroseovarius sp. F20344]